MRCAVGYGCIPAPRGDAGFRSDGIGLARADIFADRNANSDANPNAAKGRSPAVANAYTGRLFLSRLGAESDDME